MGERRYWLFKSEPDAFSFQALCDCPEQTAEWDGVRNYQSRNYLREAKLGDVVFFYHSNVKPPGIVGLAVVVREFYPDHTAWDPKEKYYDPKTDPTNPRWSMVDIRAIKPMEEYVSRDAMKVNEALCDMIVIQRGRRPSVQPVLENEFVEVLRMGKTTLSEEEILAVQNR